MKDENHHTATPEMAPTGTRSISRFNCSPDAIIQEDDEIEEEEEDDEDDDEDDDNDHNRARRSPKEFILLRWCDGNKEYLGWIMDVIARMTALIGAAVFLGTALLNLAREEVGCETEPPPGENKVPDCHERVYGLMRPSSLLTTYSLVVGLLSALLLPLMGAIIDYTNHRLIVGQVSAVLICIIMFPQIFVTENTWFAIAILLVIVAFVGWVHACVTFAYLPELSNDEGLLLKYNRNIVIAQFMGMVLFLLVMVGLTSVLGISDDDVASAQMVQAINTGLTTVLFGYSWYYLFGTREALQVLPEGASLWTAGFKKVYSTAMDIHQHYPPLQWTYISVAFSDAAVQSLAVIAVTYMTDKLEFTSTENGIAILVMLGFTLPGSIISAAVSRISSPIQSLLCALFILAINTTAAGLTLTGPGQYWETYLFAAIWGIGSGWKYPADRFLACTIMPKGQSAELMSMYLFAGQILTWLPPLVFTVMNEAGVPMQFSLITLDIFFFLSMAALLKVGNYEQAMQLVNNGDDGGNEGDDNGVSVPSPSSSSQLPLESATEEQGDSKKCGKENSEIDDAPHQNKIEEVEAAA